MQSKYTVENLVPMFYKAAVFRNEILAAGLADNAGAIHSAERILDILGQRLNYPNLAHINNLKRYPGVEFSIEAFEIHGRGGKVLIEHVAPIRDLTREAIARVTNQATPDEFLISIKENYRLVLLTPEETKRLNNRNRSKITLNRLEQADIKMR